MTIRLKKIGALDFGFAMERKGLQLFTINLPLKPDTPLGWLYFKLEIKLKLLFVGFTIKPELSIKVTT